MRESLRTTLIAGWCMATAVNLVLTVKDRQHHATQHYLAEQTQNRNHHVAGCAVIGLINDTGKADFKDCLQNSNATAEFINDPAAPIEHAPAPGEAKDAVSIT